MKAFLLRNTILYIALFGAYLAFLYWVLTDKINSTVLVNDLITFTLLYGIIIMHNRAFGKWVNKRGFPIYLLIILVLIPTDYVIGKWIYQFFDVEFMVYSYLINRWIIVAIGTLIYFNYLYFQQKQERMEMQLLKREVELTQLKQQLNPHFLYNALNNIYGYMLTDSGNDGKELLLQLSEFMRYMTESVSKEWGTLAETCTFIKHYIVFEQTRIGNRCNINLTFSGNVERSDLKIPPLLFFPLIENAFKHGAGSLQQSDVSIVMQLRGHQLEVSIRNSVPVDWKHRSSTGKGLEIVQRRLQLIYGDKFDFSVKKAEQEFECNLKIPLQ